MKLFKQSLEKEVDDQFLCYKCVLTHFLRKSYPIDSEFCCYRKNIEVLKSEIWFLRVFAGEFWFVCSKKEFSWRHYRNRFSFEKIISIDVICRLTILSITVSDKSFFSANCKFRQINQQILKTFYLWCLHIIQTLICETNQSMKFLEKHKQFCH